ncbi:RhoGAP-domain-containing protein [Dendrothele bispora CBS 962.96]|uniref:RhoGAP-domain-containing protein n=1 Tax=Dendrothele bispora (strain CBS 962.96) TaxID=1314807 RepID=A0A4V4HFL3_DENBC|nr:RhoGAP-domain-containing protein [Dendrothele bispora CBS 962.96]
MDNNALPLNHDQICPGCKLSAVSDQGGLVVAFGQSLFHVDCFKCAKCANKVTADTNLLLLSDGSPICADCSYSCNVCHLPILDEAIMSGEDSYHAHCFRCKVCKNRIDELVYAKTSQGMYCMDCHNERMIKMRKHTQKKREKEKAAAAAAAAAAASANSSLSSREHPSTPSKNYIADAFAPSFTVAPPVDERPPVFQPPPPSSDQLGVTSKRDKRRSINPGLSLQVSDTPPSNARSSSPTLSPMSAKFASSSRSPTPPTQNGHDSPRAHSPLREHFPVKRPASNGSLQTAADSPRLRTLSAGTEDQTIVMRPSSPNVGRPGSASTTLSIDHPRSPRSPSPVSRSRPMSRADVPHNVESATDESDDDDEHGIIDHYGNPSNESVPPPPPSKDRAPPPPPISLPPNGDSEQWDSSALSSSALESDDPSESSPVERTSRATFIAPALPPIRFSLNAADFSDLFNSVGGATSMKNLETLAKATERQGLKRPDEELEVPMTPPPSDREREALAPASASAATSRIRASSESSPHNGSSDELITPVAKITLTPPVNGEAKTSKTEAPPDLVFLRLQEVLADAKERGAQQMKLDRGFVEAIVEAMSATRAEFLELKGTVDGMKRASKQYIEGLTVAQTEYDRELKMRRDAEAEVTRLRVLLSGQAARLTTLIGDTKRQELKHQMTKDLNDNLSGLEQDLSKLRAERDMTLAEMEELNASKSSGSEPSANLSRSLTKRLDNLKNQYQRDLVPLIQQRETLAREVMELKASRDAFLEETTVLNARNEELAQLSAQYQRRMAMAVESERKSEEKSRPQHQGHAPQPSIQLIPSAPYPLASNPSTSTLGSDEAIDSRYNKLPKIPETEVPTPSKGRLLKWGVSRPKEVAPSSGKLGRMEHNFQPMSLLRFTRCDHCGDKMWGSQLRCTGCNISVHTRCVNHVQVTCSQQHISLSKQLHESQDEPQPLPPSMFGRDLVEQVRADAKGSLRKIPVIVEKCIEAVEAIGMDYEGIYRKTGGSGQSRNITQLFERGDYDAFDLRDSDRFNDISSVTSVLKTYLRSLPVPLLTHDLHEQFMSAVQIRDMDMKNSTLMELVDNLPVEHYCTLRLLMLHLHRIMERSEINLMNARNLGVVFGPTLMRSSNPGAEFSDMAGKALSVEWLVENAPQAFNPSKYPY